MIIKLPVTAEPAQRFNIYLNKKLLQFFIKYNERSKVWTMDLSDVITGEPLLHSIPLVLGQELLNPYNLNLGMLFMHDREALNNTDATFSDLGERVLLFWTDGDLTT